MSRARSDPHQDAAYRAAVRAALADPDHATARLAELESVLRYFADRRAARDGWAYTSPHAFLLAQGRAYHAAARPPWLRKQRNRLCYRNTAYLCMAHPRLRYVEGIALSLNGLPAEHAWAVTADGVVVDPTWYEPQLAAYWGVEIPLDLVLARSSRQRRWGILANDWLHGSRILKTGRLDALCEEEEECHDTSA